MIKYFKAEFFGLAKRRSHQTTAGGKVQFFKPDFEFVELTDWQEVSLVRLNEVEVGPHWKFQTNGWLGSGLDVFFRTDQKRFENQKLIKEVLLFPNFKDRDPSVRHVHAFTDSVHINPEWTRIQGEAYFQVEVPDAVKDLSVLLNDQTGKMEWGGTTHIVGQTDTVLDESNTDFASFNTRVNQRVLPTWNRWLNWILLLAGVGFLPLLPWLGLSLLYYPLRSWSRSSSPLATSGISMFWILLGGLLVGIAMGLKSPFAWPLALAYLLLIVVRKGARRGWVIGASVLFLLFALLAFLPLLSNRLVKESEGDGSSVVKTKREKKEGSNEVIARHTIQWLYPERTPNNAEYATSDNEYTRSLSHHGQISGLQASEELEFWNSAYAHLLQHDQGKVDSVARIVRDVAQRRKYTPLQTAEYLVTMIQEVPYVLVHDLSCKEAVMQYKGFVAQYHIQGKPCLPNIVAGVQSPYEFMHNLKGDCDTRSLFGHAVLNRLGISSSVWVSSAYGHSILGVGVPGSSGNRKVINGVPHYGVELTAKGFRIGMVAPDQRQMSNWNVAIYSNF